MSIKQSNGAPAPIDPISTMARFFQGPTGGSMLLSQHLAMEAARFWAKRVHAYADQIEVLSSCTSANDLAQAQTRFLERMRDDYAAETRTVNAMVSAPQVQPPNPAVRGKE